MTVGLTGGIGSGKSTVAIIFNALGIPIFDADREAKGLYNDPKVMADVIELFGKEIYHDREIDRQKLSDIVFSEPQKLRELEGVLYPVLSKKFEDWEEKNKKFPYKIKEAALLIEKGAYKELDIIVLVTAPKEIRIGRVMKRSSLSYDDVVKRLDEQMSDTDKLNYSDYCIRNFGDHSIVNEVFEIHSNLMERASKS